MSLPAARAKLTMLTRELKLQWEQTRDTWRDAKSQEFEKKYMDELLASVDTAVTVITKLEKLVSQVRRDCE